jgi:polygalacturonase
MKIDKPYTNKRLSQRLVVVSFALSILLLGAFMPHVKQNAEDPWKRMRDIRSEIKPPEFPNKKFSISDYGAVADGKTKCTEAFKRAIEACNKSGGGIVVVPFGTYLTGAIHLKSNVNLHLEDSAKIIFSRDTADYLPMVFTRWEGMECINYSAFIYANNQTNIAVTGNGILDGNANSEGAWWAWIGRESRGWKEGQQHQRPDNILLGTYNKMQTQPSSRIFGPGHRLRPNFIQTYQCKNVLISGIKMINSPMWNIHPVLSENVIIDGVKVVSLGPNNDGCNPESSKNVWIKNCYFDTGDDCIAIKSGRNEDGRRINKPSENIIIENCRMKEGHGGVVIGSEVSGGVKNVFAFNCEMDSPNLDIVLRIKTSSQRGGIIEHIYMKDIKVGTYKEAALRCTMFYGNPGDHIPAIRNIFVENLQVVKGGKYGILVNAYEQSPVENLNLVNCDIRGVEKPVQTDYVKNLKFTNVKINGQLVDQ